MIFNSQCTKFVFRSGVSYIFVACCCTLILSNLNFTSPFPFAVMLRHRRVSSTSWLHPARDLGRLNGISPDPFRLIIWKSRGNKALRRGEFAAFIRILRSLLTETTFERYRNKEKGTGGVFSYFLMVSEIQSNRKQICCRIVQT